ncbi:uncharacterized protein METZ01_LOCUS255642, partial [marine metagenome]
VIRAFCIFPNKGIKLFIALGFWTRANLITPILAECWLLDDPA